MRKKSFSADKEEENNSLFMFLQQVLKWDFCENRKSIDTSCAFMSFLQAVSYIQFSIKRMVFYVVIVG